MKHIIHILVIFLLVFASCSTGSKSSADMKINKNEQQNNSENNFEKYLQTLDQIPLPFSHNPLEQLSTLSQNYDKTAFEKYKHAGTSKPLGILFNDTETVILIDCAIGDCGLVPFLTTYDKRGNKIDSLGPYKKSGEDIGYKAIEYLIISKDKTILVKDSVTTYALKSENSDVDETSRKLTIGSTKYTIEKDGHIREYKEKSSQ